MIEITLDAIRIVKWEGTLFKIDGGWRATVACDIAPVANGEDVSGPELDILRAHGLPSRISTTFDYMQEIAPAIIDQGTATMTWIATQHGGLMEQWIGRSIKSGFEED